MAKTGDLVKVLYNAGAVGTCLSAAVEVLAATTSGGQRRLFVPVTDAVYTEVHPSHGAGIWVQEHSDYVIRVKTREARVKEMINKHP